MAIRIAFFFICMINVLSSVWVNAQVNHTEKETKALGKFRDLVGDVLTLDFQRLDSYLIRWLSARNFDASEANNFFRKNAKWRKDNKIDSILNETIFTFDPPVYTDDTFGYDGRPVITFTPTRVDLRRLVANGNREKVVRYFDQILEGAERRLELVSNKSNGSISRGIAMLDLLGFNIRQHTCLGCIGAFVDWIVHYDNYHPEMATHLIFINAPRVFMPVFEVLKPAFSPGTRRALKIFPSDRNEWSAYIHQIISPDQLTLQFGGTRKN